METSAEVPSLPASLCVPTDKWGIGNPLLGHSVAVCDSRHADPRKKTAYTCSVNECVVEERQRAMKSKVENYVTHGC